MKVIGQSQYSTMVYIINTLITVWGYDAEKQCAAWPAARSVQIVPPKNLSTILLGHKLNVCFTATTPAGQFRETLSLSRKEEEDTHKK